MKWAGDAGDVGDAGDAGSWVGPCSVLREGRRDKPSIFQPCTVLAPPSARILLRTEFSSGRAKPFFAKSGLQAILLRPAPIASLCQEKQPNPRLFGLAATAKDFPRPISALFGAGMSRMPAAEVKVPSIPSPLQRHVKKS